MMFTYNLVQFFLTMNNGNSIFVFESQILIKYYNNFAWIFIYPLCKISNKINFKHHCLLLLSIWICFLWIINSYHLPTFLLGCVMALTSLIWLGLPIFSEIFFLVCIWLFYATNDILEDWVYWKKATMTL